MFMQPRGIPVKVKELPKVLRDNIIKQHPKGGNGTEQ